MNVVQPIRDLDLIRDIEEDLKERSERDWLLFVAGVNSGLRISDLLRLRVEDVGGQHLVITEKKTKKRKFLRITPKLVRCFRVYIEGKQGRHYLFGSRQGGNRPMTRARAYQILRQVAARHGLKHIGTHTLRKTFGYHFYRATGNVALLMTIFEHSDQATTLRYIGINQDEMDAAMQRFEL